MQKIPKPGLSVGCEGDYVGEPSEGVSPPAGQIASHEEQGKYNLGVTTNLAFQKCNAFFSQYFKPVYPRYS